MTRRTLTTHTGGRDGHRAALDPKTLSLDVLSREVADTLAREPWRLSRAAKPRPQQVTVEVPEGLLWEIEQACAARGLEVDGLRLLQDHLRESLLNFRAGLREEWGRLVANHVARRVQ